LAAPTALAGSDTDRPSERQSMSMFQPKPQRFCPPMIFSIGMKTS
jgi:hypothetical protein